MKTRAVTIVIIITLCIAVVSAYVLKKNTRVRRPQVAHYAPSALKEADRLFEEARFGDALKIYEGILEKRPEDYGTLWRAAHSYDMWALLIDKKDPGADYLSAATNYARKAIEINDDGFEGHLYLAESLGLLLRYRGAAERVRFVKEVRKEALRAMEIDPSKYRPYLILGMWHRKVCEASWLERKLADIFFGGIPEASMDKSISYLKKAVELEPDMAKTNFELAMTYKDTGDDTLVIKYLTKAVGCVPRDSKDREAIKRSGKIIGRLKQKMGGGNE